MKATVSWKENLRFNCKTDTGHTLDLEGNGEILSPMESVLLSVGACSSIDVVDILKKSRKQVDDCVCQLEAKRAEEPPRFSTEIHSHYIVKRHGSTQNNFARATHLSTSNY